MPTTRLSRRSRRQNGGPLVAITSTANVDSPAASVCVLTTKVTSDKPCSASVLATPAAVPSRSVGQSVSRSAGRSGGRSVGWLVGVGRSVCLSVCRSVGLSVCLSVCLPVCLSVIVPLACLSVRSSACPNPQMLL